MKKVTIKETPLSLESLLAEAKKMEDEIVILLIELWTLEETSGGESLMNLKRDIELIAKDLDIVMGITQRLEAIANRNHRKYRKPP